ncbi:MAG: PstS family phosphate ABC transporter substrate-binding protein [Candidatus Marinimicrobia bacterium]|nr:PstS family phosphate ABC transporter substrate-binding protein [Candidatus Neomarinimicrobiota bacterium]
MKRMISTISLALLTLVLMSNCGGEKESKNETATVKYISIKGSDTMVHLASNWAEVYMDTHKDVDISVTGGGSGTGIAALLNGTTDICIASRRIKSTEEKLALEKGLAPNEIVTSRDGIAVVVNPANPISELSIEQIGKMYTGAYTSWKEVGGPDEPIVILSRESSSGTYVFFQKRVMNKKDYTQEALLMPSTAAIIQSVAQDTWAIGYVGLGYGTQAGEKVKMLGIKDAADTPAISASVATVQDDTYSIARPLHFYTNGTPTGATKDFIDFVLSEDGQAIVMEAGYVPVNY